MVVEQVVIPCDFHGESNHLSKKSSYDFNKCENAWWESEILIAKTGITQGWKLHLLLFRKIWYGYINPMQRFLNSATSVSIIRHTILFAARISFRFGATVWRVLHFNIWNGFAFLFRPLKMRYINTRLTLYFIDGAFYVYTLCCYLILQGYPWYSGSVLDCWSTGRAMDPASGAFFKTKIISLAKVVPGHV